MSEVLGVCSTVLLALQEQGVTSSSSRASGSAPTVPEMELTGKRRKTDAGGAGGGSEDGSESSGEL